MLKNEEGEASQSGLEDGEGLNKAGLALLEFLVPRRTGQQASAVPSYALLSGPPKCGKTSLLLQLAYNLAVDARARVVFICKPKNFEDDYIYRSPEMDTPCGVSDRVHIKYIKDDQELQKYFAAFHLHLELPTAVIVDNFVDYFGDSYAVMIISNQGTDFVVHQEEGIRRTRAAGELPLVKTLCLCRNAIDYANEKAMYGVQCKLVISDTHLGEVPRLLYIFKRWLSQVFVIKALDDLSAFSLELQDVRTGEKGDVVGRYMLAQQVLQFDGLQLCLQPVVKSDVLD